MTTAARIPAKIYSSVSPAPMTTRSRAPITDASAMIRTGVKFRVWKSGGRVEARLLGTLERLERALALYLIIAWRILHRVTWGRDGPNLPCNVVSVPSAFGIATGGP